MATKPKKPRPDFPLFPHAAGQWAKKIKGKLYYFGVWADPQGALSRYREAFPYLNIGLPVPSDYTSLADILNAFDDDKKALLDAGRITERTYNEYMDVCETIATLGKYRPIEAITQADLRKLNHKLGLGKRGQPVSPVTHKRLLTFARMVFYFANEILDCNVKYRAALKPPEKRLIRERRIAAGERMFSAPEIRALLERADPHMKAVIYLGINCGFGPKDCVELEPRKIANGFVSFPRPKTGVQRRCPLWTQTQAAIGAISGDVHVLDGRTWNRYVIARELKKLCEACEVDGKPIYKEGITTPYSLRRTFETVAKNSNVNQSVIDKIMGHERPDMSEIYNQKTFDKQLIRCTDFVYRWLQGLETL